MPVGCAGLAARRAEGYLKTRLPKGSRVSAELKRATLLPTHIVPQAISGPELQ